MLTALLLAAATAYAHPEQLVDTAWVAAHNGDAKVRIVDVRRTGYAGGHIPNAVALDPESVRDPHNAPTFLPSQAAFESMMANLGISNGMRIVAYDDRGGLYATRLWWILNAFGYRDVAVVDGGWVAWLAEHRPVTTARRETPSGVFKARLDSRWVATAADVLSAIDKPGVRIVDARTQGEMDGSDTRNSRRPGIVPSAVPVYWEDLLDPVRKTFKPADEIRAIYEARGIRPSDDVIAYCQVGHRSSVDLFALHLIGYSKLRNYLGSWEEWGNRPELPVQPFK